MGISGQNFGFFGKFYLNWLSKILPIMARILVIGSQCVNSLNISDLSKRDVF